MNQASPRLTPSPVAELRAQREVLIMSGQVGDTSSVRRRHFLSKKEASFLQEGDTFSARRRHILSIDAGYHTQCGFAAKGPFRRDHSMLFNKKEGEQQCFLNNRAEESGVR